MLINLINICDNDQIFPLGGYINYLCICTTSTGSDRNNCSFFVIRTRKNQDSISSSFHSTRTYVIILSFHLPALLLRIVSISERVGISSHSIGGWCWLIEEPRQSLRSDTCKIGWTHNYWGNSSLKTIGPSFFYNKKV